MSMFKKIGSFLTKPDLFFYALIWMMVILVFGTVAQKYVGLYRAQHMYFFSYYWWLGPVPLPGGYPTMAVIFLNLLAKLFFASQWHPTRAGTLIVHFGALLLLTGGLLTALFSREGNMTIYEGTKSDYFSDYHERELVVEDGSSGEKVIAYPWKDLKTGKILSVPKLNFTIEIVKAFRNCEMVPRSGKTDDPLFKELRGRAKDFDMKSAPLEKEDEINKSGIMFRVAGASPEKNGIHFTVDFVSVSPWIEVDGTTYTISLRRARTFLPFKIKLLDFEKQVYQGTDIPSSYKSVVEVMEGDSQWRSIIRMNDPLRYKGYTFYQSSFIEGEDKSATILAVVKNTGRLFPYISSIIMCVGLLIHLFLQLPKLIKKS